MAQLHGSHPMTKILSLAYRMAPGFGVSVVVDALAASLRPQIDVEIAAVDIEGQWSSPVHRIAPTPLAVRILANEIGATHVVAHTSPFFEALPELRDQFICLAWEHGDPTPALFDHDRQERQQVITIKQDHIYPNVDAVIAISRFIAKDIGWPQATVISNGTDHVSRPETTACKQATDQPFRIGTLMRLGDGEAYYKGNKLFLETVAEARRQGITGQFEVMGRGTDLDAQAFQQQGLKVHLNASDAARDAYLSELDVFLSCSLWEGFNLPLLEAQAQGTIGLAFDVGAHPETTPFLMSNRDDMVAQIAAYHRNPELLAEHRKMARAFAARFTWQTAAGRFITLLESLPTRPSQRPRYQAAWVIRLRARLGLVRHYAMVLGQSLRRHGLSGTWMRIKRRLIGSNKR
jgi:glycosyltransferase involved in cell wall biosynthesis